eukprot:g8274.t1
MGCIQSFSKVSNKNTNHNNVNNNRNGKIYPEVVNNDKDKMKEVASTHEQILQEAAKAQHDDNQRRSNNNAKTDAGNNNSVTTVKTKLNLIKASKNGNLEIVKEILQDIKINTTNSIYNIDQLGMWDNTPLVCACQYGHEAIAIELLRNGANPNVINEKGCTPLLHASVEGCLNIVKEILKYNGDANLIPLTPIYNQHLDTHEPYTPLLASVTNGFHEITKELLLHNASMDVVNKNNEDLLRIALFNAKCEKTVLHLLKNNWILKNNDREYILQQHKESNTNDFEEVVKYLEEGQQSNNQINGDDNNSYDKENNAENESSLVVKEVVETKPDTNDSISTTPIKLAKNNETRKVAMTPVVLKID